MRMTPPKDPVVFSFSVSTSALQPDTNVQNGVCVCVCVLVAAPAPITISAGSTLHLICIPLCRCSTRTKSGLMNSFIHVLVQTLNGCKANSARVCYPPPPPFSLIRVMSVRQNPIKKVFPFSNIFHDDVKVLLLCKVPN